MALTSALRLSLACLLLCSAAPKPTCDPSACAPCPEEDPEGTATPTAAGCCPPCPPPCACPPYLESDCEMQGFASGRVPAGRSFYIDFARKLCTCHPAGDITCAPLCPPCPPPAAPWAARWPTAVPAASATTRRRWQCPPAPSPPAAPKSAPALSTEGQLRCRAPGSEE
ncbi:fibulin-2-like [Corvus cornix cornix]|uniref:fibulin-2-like n=1 Tax=Corvus cornix cornix TaxID=932674 RepID=UPI001951325B|nr:fibulin-2-like [Corvus cornix cornix]